LLPIVLLCVLASASGAATPKPGLWGRYLLAYSSCDQAGAACREQLAQSRDGLRWSAVVGFAPRAGSRPVAAARGSRLYVFDGPIVRRFTVSKAAVTELPSAGVQLDSGEALSGEDIVVDPSGALVLVYPAPAADGSGVAIRTATEVAGSDGVSFTADAGERAVLSAGTGAPSVLLGRSGWVVFVADDTCLRALAAGNVHGAYRDTGCLTTPAPLSFPSGYWNARLHEYWLYGVSAGALRRATAPKVNAPIASKRFRPLAALATPGRTIQAVDFSHA
jgi:hypothetical protein